MIVYKDPLVIFSDRALYPFMPFFLTGKIQGFSVSWSSCFVFFCTFQTPEAYLPVPGTSNYGHVSFPYGHPPLLSTVPGSWIHIPCIPSDEALSAGLSFSGFLFFISGLCSFQAAQECNTVISIRHTFFPRHSFIFQTLLIISVIFEIWSYRNSIISFCFWINSS